MRRDAVAEIRERTDIVELVNAYTPLKKAGRSFKGLCPFHQQPLQDSGFCPAS